MVADRWPAVIIGNAHRSAVCLMVGAFVSCWLASSIHLLWVSIAVYVLAALTAAVGFVMTFRDYSF